MTQRTVADFLTPAGFSQPRLGAVLREGSVVREAGQYALRAVASHTGGRRTPYAGHARPRSADPVLLVPGFLAGDGSLRLMAASLQREGFRTYGSHIHANIGCTLSAIGQVEARLEQIVQHRDARVQIVGHSLGGMLARAVAARRPDLVSGIVTMGSPMLAPGAHHLSLARAVDVLVRLNRAGMRGLMAAECVAGECARQGFEQAQASLSEDVSFTAIYSRRDGIVDWRACIDPAARAVEVAASHVGMAVSPAVIDQVVAALAPRAVRSVVEVDRGETA